MNQTHSFSIVVCARWENPFIVEFLDYYREIGFDHVFLYCNDDDPAALRAKIDEATFGIDHFVTFRHHPIQGQQREMYLDFLTEFGHSSEWFGFFDVDEFLRLPPETSITRFMERWESDIGAVLFNWIFFGPNGHKVPPAEPVLEAFTRRANLLHPLTKFLIRSDALVPSPGLVHTGSQPFWHQPNGLISEKFRIVDVLGDDAQNYYNGFPADPTNFINEPERHARILSTAVIHHYAFRSEQAFAERAARGTFGAFVGQDMWKSLSEGEGFAGFLASINQVSDGSLADFWHTRPNLHELPGPVQTSAVEPPSAAPVLISLNKPATQSSISPWSRGATTAADAAGAVDGTIDGRPGFHTDLEDHPWWQIDLQAIATITEIRIYNRLDQPETADRSARLAIGVGTDSATIAEVYRRDQTEPFGGIDGKPLVFRPTSPITGRFVRIDLLTRNYLHLDQVEIYGNPLPMPASALLDSTAVYSLPDLSDRAVLDRFQSAGNNCEFGSVQKSVGIGKLSLLQWTSSNPEMIVRGMRDEFETYGQPGTIEPIDHHGEYFSRDRTYGFESHSFIGIGTMDADEFVKTVGSKTRFLIRKFREDLEDGAHIFVYNFFEGTLPSINTLREMAAEFSRYADNYLLAVGLSGDYCSEQNKVFHVEKGLLLATKDRFTTFNSTPIDYRPGWIAICRQALSIIRDQAPQFWDIQERRIRDNGAIIAAAPVSQGNLCRGKSATQSSLSAFSIGTTLADDANGAIDGHINGQMKFHTDLEDSPWWQVDLGGVFGITHVKIFNRMDVPSIMARASRLAIEIGLHDDHLVEVFRRETDDPFGGITVNGRSVGEIAGPMIFAPSIPIPGRFVRIRLLTRTYLHLDQVEVHGDAFPVATSRAA